MLFRSRRALALYGELSGTSHGSYVIVSLNLARALREAGRAEDADSIFRAIVARGDTTSVVKRGALLMARIGIVNGMIDRGLADEALPLAEEVDAVARRDLRTTDSRRAEAHFTLGRTLVALDQRPRATAALLAADSILAPMRRAHPQLSARLTAELRRVRARP